MQRGGVILYAENTLSVAQALYCIDFSFILTDREGGMILCTESNTAYNTS